MRKKEAGQAFILVLILLAIGALLIVPALRLSYTHLRSSQIVVQKTKSLYAASAAQEWVLWNLKQPAFANDFTLGVPKDYTIDVCGTPVNITIVMRAVEGAGGITLATDDVIRPTKMVKPEKVDDGSYQTYTYTIKLEQLSDNTSQGLDAIYDILPKDFDPNAYYLPGTSELSLDNGNTWERFPEPSYNFTEGHLVLRWPDEGNFATPIRDFAVRQVKKLKFVVEGQLKKEGVYSNWVVLKVGDTNTLSGAQAPITVGSPTANTTSTGMLQVSKTSDPKIIPPFVETTVTYIITITNLDIHVHQIESITDYLPPEFYYSCNSTSGLTNLDPEDQYVENINGVDRQVLRWYFDIGDMPIHKGVPLTLSFQAMTTKKASGSYYNEVIVFTDMEEDIRKVFESIGVSAEEFGSNFSWNTGTVLVPAYNSEADADGTIIDANLSLRLGGVEFASWHIR